MGIIDPVNYWMKEIFLSSLKGHIHAVSNLIKVVKASKGGTEWFEWYDLLLLIQIWRDRIHPIFRKLYHTTFNAESCYDFAI